jgi:hypothetical protein
VLTSPTPPPTPMIQLGSVVDHGDGTSDVTILLSGFAPDESVFVKLESTGFPPKFALVMDATGGSQLTVTWSCSTNGDLLQLLAFYGPQLQQLVTYAPGQPIVDC